MFFNGPVGWRILKGEKKMQKLGPFLDLLFYFDPKKLFNNNNTSKKVTSIYPGNLCLCVCVYIHTLQWWRKIHDTSYVGSPTSYKSRATCCWQSGAISSFTFLSH
jgi:hypothetical protein